MFAQHRAFTFAAITALALGIGATTDGDVVQAVAGFRQVVRPTRVVMSRDN
jgi:hypothetical protein